MRSMSSDRFQELLLNATGETLYMVLLRPFSPSR